MGVWVYGCMGVWAYDGTEFPIQIHSENEPNVVSLKGTKGDWIPILKKA